MANGNEVVEDIEVSNFYVTANQTLRANNVAFAELYAVFIIERNIW